MKKLVFGIVAVFMFVLTGNAQEGKFSEEYLTNEGVRLELAKGFISFNESVEGVYKESESLEDFKKKLCGSGLEKITLVGEKLLDKSYKTLKEGTTKESILKDYNGKEMADVTAFLLLNKCNSNEADIFGGSPNSSDTDASTSRQCRWYQIGCHLENFWNWITNTKNLEKIYKAVKIIYYIGAIF